MAFLLIWGKAGDVNNEITIKSYNPLNSKELTATNIVATSLTSSNGKCYQRQCISNYHHLGFWVIIPPLTSISTCGTGIRLQVDGLNTIDLNEIDFLKAIKLLDNKQPKQALVFLQKLYQITYNFSYYEDVRWYLALAELKLHNKSEAKKYLNELVDSEVYAEKVKVILAKL